MKLARLIMGAVLGRRLVTTTGEIEVAGINADVAIRRDRYGIPHVDVREDDDAWFGLGFCHGQDRSFQLEMLLRLVRGTVAALVGPEALPIDRFSRRLGLLGSARAQAPALDDDVRRIFEAYARGVNAGRRDGVRRVAHEFALLRSSPSPFSAVDSIAVAALQGVLLGSWTTKLVRLKVATLDGPEALVAVDGTYPEWLPVTDPPGADAGRAVDAVAENVRAFASLVGARTGSNNWALAATRTATGRPLLANDPHLVPVHPPHWYLAHLRTPRWEVAGASLVGLPGILSGHNDVAAWGLTASFVDNVDLAIEQLGPGRRSVRRGGVFVPCEVRREVIEVRGRETVTDEVVVTPEGPIIGPGVGGDVGAVSIRATWLQPRTLRAALGFHVVRSFDELRRACAHWPTSGQNVVYADTGGTIGWQLAGDVPRRRRGHGVFPVAGAEVESAWNADVRFEELPHAADPAGGWIATANNKPVVDDGGPWLGGDWADGYRVAAIGEALDARHDWDITSSQLLQMDVRSMPWRDLRSVVLGVTARGNDSARALALLGEWDGNVGVGSTAASVFEVFLAELSARIVRARAPKSAEWVLGTSVHPLAERNSFARIGHVVRLLREQPSGWFTGGWDEEIDGALAASARRLEAFGDESKWGWGRVRPLTFRHVLGSRKPFDRIFDVGPIPWGGDENTVSAAGASLDGPWDAVASMRMVVDVGNWGASRFSLPGGQSGNPLSPHYEDLLEHWKRGTGVPVAWAERDVAAATVGTLRLRAGPGREMQA